MILDRIVLKGRSATAFGGGFQNLVHVTGFSPTTKPCAGPGK